MRQDRDLLPHLHLRGSHAIPVQVRLGSGGEGKTASQKHDIIVFNLERTSRFDFWVFRATYHAPMRFSLFWIARFRRVQGDRPTSCQPLMSLRSGPKGWLQLPMMLKGRT